MSLDAIRQVDEAERKAGQMISDAQAQARAVVAQAQRSVDTRHEAAMKDVARLAGESAVRAREQAAEVAARQEEASRADCSALRASAMTRFDRAVSIVVEKVVND